MSDTQSSSDHVPAQAGIVHVMPGIAQLAEAARGGALVAEVELRREVSRMLSADDRGRSEIERFLREASPRDWITFDRSMRAFWYGEDRPTQQTWWRRAWNAGRAERSVPSDVLAVGLSSMDRDGRVREAAVRRLATEPDSLVGPFLALRTTDWVESVATMAATVLAERMATDTAVLVGSAPLLFALTNRQRSAGVESAVLERAALDAEVRAALLASADIQTRRRVIKEAAAHGAATLAELVSLAQTDRDTVVASTAGVEAVSRTTENGTGGAVLASLLAGPALVRRAVLDALADRGEGADTAEHHLFDRSPAVRAAAQRAYRRSDRDPAAIYRAAVARNEHVPIAVMELAIVGSRDDHPMILSALHSHDVATRRAAVNAARWVAGDRLSALITPLLWDDSAGVTRAVERRLRAKAGDLDAAMLLDLTDAPQNHSRRAAYRLMRRRSAAERIEADLIALRDVDEGIRRDAIADLRSWLQRGAASAPRGDLATRLRLSQRLDAVQDQLRDDDVRGLRFHAGLRAKDLVS